MIQYPDSYFEDEIRCGFRITKLMKCCWAAQIEVLEEIEKICKKYNLQYFAYAGTLLGAVRHKGFIPWDDDMDIVLKRSDYNVLMKVLIKELPDYFDVYSIYNRPDWPNTFGRVVNAKALPMSEEQLNKFYGFPLPAGIDIFPLDYVPKNTELADIQKSLLNLTWRMIKNLIYDMNGEYTEADRKIVIGEIQEAIGILAEFCSIPSFENRSLLQVFQLIFEQLSMLGNESDSDYCTDISTFYSYGYEYMLQKEWFDEAIDMGFEYGTIKVPCGYESILSECYPDYMKFVRGGQVHEYPYYQKAIKLLKESGSLIAEVDPKDLGVPDEDNTIGSIEEVSDNWKKRVGISKLDGKRVVLFQPMLTSMLAKEEKYIETIDKILDLLIQNASVLIWFRPHINEHVPYCDMRPELFEKYSNICKKYQYSEKIIYDITDNQMGAIELCDIYVGDSCPLSDEFIGKGKEFLRIDFTDERPEKFVMKL